MNVVYNILVVIAVLIAISFSLLVLLTGKGDAMNGGASVRTTFKGKASFDDIMSKWTLWFGVGFMGLVLVIDVISKQLATAVPVIDRDVDVTLPTNAPVSVPLPAANGPVTTSPTANAPEGNSPVANVPATPSASNAAPSSTVPPATGSNTAAGNGAGSFLTPPSSSEPSVVPSTPGTSGTTTGGAANAAPPVGNR